MKTFRFLPFAASVVLIVLTFVLTYGVIDSLAHGTKEFAEELLQDIGLPDAGATNWVLEPYRSKYYSDYLDEDDWRGIWQVVWKMSISVQLPVPINAFDKFLFETSADDGSWSNANSLDDEAPLNCLIVSDFENEKILNKAKSEITRFFSESSKQFSNQYTIQNPQFSRIDIYKGYKQLQINLGKFDHRFYEEGAIYAESILSICQNLGGIIHYDAH